MKTYKVTITETLSKIIEVKAKTPEKAIRQAEDEYNACEHVLTYEDYIGVEFTVPVDGNVMKLHVLKQ